MGSGVVRRITRNFLSKFGIYLFVRYFQVCQFKYLKRLICNNWNILYPHLFTILWMIPESVNPQKYEEFLPHKWSVFFSFLNCFQRFKIFCIYIYIKLWMKFQFFAVLHGLLAVSLIMNIAISLLVSRESCLKNVCWFKRSWISKRISMIEKFFFKNISSSLINILFFFDIFQLAFSYFWYGIYFFVFDYILSFFFLNVMLIIHPN